MATLRLPQNNFSSGVMDQERMRGRSDIKQYFQAVKRANNVLVHPQGGLYRRPGTRMLEDLSAYDNFRMIDFDYSDTIVYLLLFYGTTCEVWDKEDDTLIVSFSTALTETQLREMDYAQSGNSLILVHTTMEPLQISRGATESDWTIAAVAFDSLPLYGFTLTYSNPSATLTPSATSGNVTLTAGSSVFSATDVGGYVTGNGGEARITKYVSGTVVEAKVTLAFISSGAISSGSWELENGYEDAWSISRGYPGAVGYDNDCLLLGCTPSLPDVVWKSKIGEFFNFDDTRAAIQDAMSFSMRSDKINNVRYIVSADDLVLITSEAEFYVDGKLTPELDFKIKKQEERGSKIGAKPCIVDGSIVYLDARANILRELAYYDLDGKYNSTPLNLFCPSIINDPLNLSHLKPEGTRDSDYVFVVNGDGTWAVLNTMLKQQITAFTSGSTPNGQMLAVKSVDGKLYAIFERTINGATKRFLEVFDEDITLDCAVVYDGAATDNVTGLGHLTGETVSIVADGTSHPDEEVVAGIVELDGEYENIVVGIDYGITIETLPPVRELPDGTMIGEIRRISAVTLGLSSTADVAVNDIPIKFRRFGEDLFGASSPLFSGRKRLTLRGGFSREPSLTITQTSPLSFHMTDMVMEVSI